MPTRVNYSTNPNNYRQLLSAGVRPSQIRAAINNGLDPGQLPPEYFGLQGGWTPSSVSNQSYVPPIGEIDIPPASMGDPYSNPFGDSRAGYDYSGQGVSARGDAFVGQPSQPAPFTDFSDAWRGYDLPSSVSSYTPFTDFSSGWTGSDPFGGAFASGEGQQWDFTGTPTSTWSEPGALGGTGEIPIPQGFGDFVQPPDMPPVGEPTVDIPTDPFAGAQAPGDFGSGVDPLAGAEASGDFGSGTTSDIPVPEGFGDLVTPPPMPPVEGYTGGFGVGSGPQFGITPEGFSTGYIPFGGAGSGGSIPGTAGGSGGAGPQFSGGGFFDSSLFQPQQGFFGLGGMNAGGGGYMPVGFTGPESFMSKPTAVGEGEGGTKKRMGLETYLDSLPQPVQTPDEPQYISGWNWQKNPGSSAMGHGALPGWWSPVRTAGTGLDVPMPTSKPSKR